MFHSGECLSLPSHVFIAGQSVFHCRPGRVAGSELNHSLIKDSLRVCIGCSHCGFVLFVQ